jgi:hypothetical protein
VAKKTKKTVEPNVEIFLAHPFDEEEIDDDCITDAIKCALKTGQEHPDAKIKSVDVKGLSWTGCAGCTERTVEYLVIYRSLNGKAVSNSELVKAVKKVVDRFDGEDE